MSAKDSCSDATQGCIPKSTTARMLRIAVDTGGTFTDFYGLHRGQLIPIGGVDGSGRPYAYYETLAGGMGAWPGGDGLSGVHTHMTNSLNTPVEALAHEYPFRVRRYALRRNSGGTGRFRGGDGLVREYAFDAPAQVTVLSERRRFAPPGASGGAPGRRGRNVFLRGGRTLALPGKLQFREATCCASKHPGEAGSVGLWAVRERAAAACVATGDDLTSHWTA